MGAGGIIPRAPHHHLTCPAAVFSGHLRSTPSISSTHSENASISKDNKRSFHKRLPREEELKRIAGVAGDKVAEDRRRSEAGRRAGRMKERTKNKRILGFGGLPGPACSGRERQW